MSNIRQSVMLSTDQLDELKGVFSTIDADGNGSINVAELSQALEVCGFKLPGYEVRDLIREFDSKIKDDKLDFEEFKAIVARYHSLKVGGTFKGHISRATNIERVVGATEESQHFVRRSEHYAFSHWLNRNCADDPDCKKYLPLDPNSRDLYNKCNDGILFCKMINQSQPGTIDERTINKGKMMIYQIHENLTLAINSAQAIGCNVVNIGPEDLHAGKPHLVLGLLWQIIRIGLLADIDIVNHPGLATLLMDGETLEEFRKLSPEQILIRWVNYHLARSNCGRQISNFQSDIKDSVSYIHLLHQISPKDAGVTTLAENESDELERAERMLQEADKIGCRAFVSPDDVVGGNYKLNLAYVANLFNNYPALDTPEGVEGLEDLHEETREEKMYRNWMNSMGVSPYVNYLYSDLCNGLVIFQLYDIIKPGIVDWSRVHKKFNKMRMLMEKIENCNYAVELGKLSKFSLVGIDGKDLYDGNETLTLALVWQLMKAYTLSILTKLAGQDSGHPIVEREIISWVNDKLASSKKSTKITGFNDPTISDAKVFLDLVDSIKPGAINYDQVKAGNTDQERLDNAKLAISMARKIGSRVYALPEDIVEVKSKMVMTVFACMMIKDYQPEQVKVNSE